MDPIEKRINAVKRKMHELGPMRPGSLSRQTHKAGGRGLLPGELHLPAEGVHGLHPGGGLPPCEEGD